MVFKLASTAGSELGRVGSMMSRSPSLRIMDIFARELEFTRDPDCLVPTILEELHMSFRSCTHVSSIGHIRYHW